MSYFEDEPLEKLKEQKETHFLWMGMQMIEERELHQKGMTPALASELIAKNIHPDQYIVPPEESIYRYIYRPDGSYEPLAQIRQLTDAEIVANQKNDPASTWQQVPDISKLDAGNKAEETAQTPVSTYEIRYYQNHINGAPEELVDFAGNILWAENATAWGKDCYDIETTQRGTHQPLRFQGQYRDVESGLHYNTFRYYNPHNGRFISQDPIGLNGGINLYQYAPNPISWIDPWGLTCKLDGNTIKKADGSDLITIPDDAKVRKLTPPDGYVGDYGYEYKWKNAEGTTTVRIHGPDTTAPIGANASDGWIVRIMDGKKSMDSNGNFYPAGIFNKDSPFYNPSLINDVHIPIDKPINFPGVK